MNRFTQFIHRYRYVISAALLLALAGGIFFVFRPRKRAV
jgi:hypothetical protein